MQNRQPSEANPTYRAGKAVVSPGTAAVLRNPVFTQHSDGSVTVDAFPPTFTIARHLLEQARPDLLERKGRALTIRVANDTATYRLTRRVSWQAYEAVRV